ncbi:MAG: transposase, partial [Chloroflexi bacterium]|nr:transposase [Chloroflexota bacterium]
MARPLLIDGKLPMKIFNNNGYRYAVTRTSVRKADGKYNHPQSIWGTIDEGLNFTPNERFLALDESERAGILVPAEWNIISPEVTMKVKRGHPSYDRESTSLLYGHTWFLDLLSDQCGVKDDLEHVFEDAAKVAQILTMAYYNLQGIASYNHLENEQRICWYPCEKPLAPCDITRVTQSITEAHKQALFRCRKFRSTSKSCLGIDSTSFTYFGKSLAAARWGKNKENDRADQLNVLVVYDMTNGMPVYYRKMPGNLPDTRTMRVTLQELKNNDFTNLRLVFDRGYISQEVYTKLIKHRHKFIMMFKNSDPQINQAIQNLDAEEMMKRQNWIDKHQVYGKFFDYDFKIETKGAMTPVKSMRFCLFFDPELQVERRKNINATVTEMENQLEGMMAEKQPVDDFFMSRFSKYFSLTLKKDKTLKSYLPDDEKITGEVNKAGYFSIVTNGMSPSQCELSEILDIYKMRNEQEKAFMFVKSEQEGRRFRTSTETSTDGRLFIQFVALILNCIINRKYQASETLQNLFPTRKHMLDELKSIR